MIRRPRELDDGRKYFSPVFATVCVFAALALVLVMFRFGTRISAEHSGYTLNHIEDASTFDLEHGFAVRHANGNRMLFQRWDESDATAFSVEEATRRADVVAPGKRMSVPVLVLISPETEAGEFAQTIEELRKVGFLSFSIVDSPSSDEAP